LSARCLLFATWSLCDVVAACRVRSCAGEYTLTGVWMNKTQTWALSPGTWLTNPCNYVMVGFSGTIDVVAGLLRFSGSLAGAPGCTTFVLMALIPTGAPVLSPFCTSSGTTAYKPLMLRLDANGAALKPYRCFGAAAPTPLPTNLGDTNPPTTGALGLSCPPRRVFAASSPRAHGACAIARPCLPAVRAAPHSLARPCRRRRRDRDRRVALELLGQLHRHVVRARPRYGVRPLRVRSSA
jgi:hypothetical protein